MAPTTLATASGPLRWPLLIPFILYVAALIAVVEVVGRTFPSSDDIRDNATAFFSAPLVARAAPPLSTPTPTPTPRKISARAHGRLFRRSETESPPPDTSEAFNQFPNGRGSPFENA